MGVGARINFGLEAIALVEIEQPDRAQHRDRL
jgi:hypothetical protein